VRREDTKREVRRWTKGEVGGRFTQEEKKEEARRREEGEESGE